MEWRGGDKGINSEKKRRNRWQNARSHQRNRRVFVGLLPQTAFPSALDSPISLDEESSFARRKVAVFPTTLSSSKRKRRGCREEGERMHGRDFCRISIDDGEGKISRLLAERREFIFAC